MDNMEQLLSDMINHRLASTGSSWIERAVEQKNDRMTIHLASSVLLAYSDLDIVLLQKQILN